MIDFFGHLSYAFCVGGTYMVGTRKRAGWVVRGVGDVGWVSCGLAIGLSSIWVWGSIFVVLDVIGWRKWKRRDTLPKLNPSTGEPA